MINHFDDFKKHIDDKGNFSGTPEEFFDSIKAVEKLAKSMLGATISVRGKKFIIRMLEIYYGGIGDTAHDWHRKRFKNNNSSLIEHQRFKIKKVFVSI